MRLVLFVEPEPVEAVLAVLEMVLAIVWLLGRLRHWDSAPCATGEEFKGRRDVPWGRGSLVCVCTRSPRRAAQRRAEGAGLVPHGRAGVLRRTTSRGTDGARPS